MRLPVIAFAGCLLFFPAFWLFAAAAGPNWGAGIAVVVAFVFFPAAALSLWKPPAQQRSSIDAALDAGELGIATYEVTDAIRIEESEDEGFHFMLAVGPAKTLVLSGQYLYGPVETGRFPSRELVVLWHERHGHTFGVRCSGDPISVSRKLPALSSDDWAAGLLPSDRSTLDVALSEALVSLERVGR